MTAPYTLIPNLDELLTEVPQDSILSRTFYSDDQVKAILFSFAAGQELSEHTASVPAIIHILHGEAELTLGGDRVEGRAGTWIHMPPNLKHSIVAKTPLIMLLTMGR